MAPRKSMCWKYFEHKDHKSACCRNCGETVVHHSNTTNLTRHLKRKHASLYAASFSLKANGTEEVAMNDLSDPDDPPEMVDITNNNVTTTMNQNAQETLKSSNISSSSVKQPRISDYVNELKEYKESSYKYQKISEAIVYLIVKANLPFSIVDNEAFVRFMKIVAPMYPVPCRSTIVSRIDDKYSLLQPLKKRNLEEVNHIALTADLWTEPNNTTPVMGVTAHYIARGSLESIILGCDEFSERHTERNIADYMTKLLEKWNIPATKISGIVTDNAKNIENACKLVVEKDLHFPCFAHSLNLVVTNSGFKPSQMDTNDDEESNKISLQTIVKKVKRIVTWFHQSHVGAAEIKIAEELRLIQSCPTRWNSLYKMIERFLKLANSVAEILLKHPEAPCMVSAAEIAVLKDTQTVLQFFDEATKDCSAEKSVTISRLTPIHDWLCNQLEECHVETGLGKAFLKKIKDEMKTRFGTLEKHYLCSVSTILDPRLKKIHFQDPLDATVNRINKLIDVDKDRHQLSSSSSINEVNTPTTSVSRSINDFSKRKAEQHNISKREFVESPEVSVYLQTKTEDVESDPLLYWEKNKHTFPTLYKLADKFLCIQGTSTASERLFSLAGFIMNERRNRITPERLARLLFLKYLRFEDWYMD